MILIATFASDSERIEQLWQKVFVTYQVEDGLTRGAWMFGPDQPGRNVLSTITARVCLTRPGAI